MKTEDKQFWKFLWKADWTIDEEKLYLELEDFSMLIETLSDITYTISDWMLSKPNYTTWVLRGQLEEKWIQKDYARDDMLAYIQDYKWEELKEQIKLYFNQ